MVKKESYDIKMGRPNNLYARQAHFSSTMAERPIDRFEQPLLLLVTAIDIRQVVQNEKALPLPLTVMHLATRLGGRLGWLKRRARPCARILRCRCKAGMKPCTSSMIRSLISGGSEKSIPWYLNASQHQTS